MSRGMKWFKHWNEASDGHTLAQFIRARDYESYTLFWVLSELMSRNGTRQENGASELTINVPFLAHKMGMKPSKLYRVMERFFTIAQTWTATETAVSQTRNQNDTTVSSQDRSRFVPISFSRSEHDTRTVLKFLCSNWLEFQETRGQKKIEKSANEPGEERREKREERNEEERIVPGEQNAAQPEQDEIDFGFGPPAEDPPPPPAKGPTLGSRIWGAYCEAIAIRHQILPVRNKTTNSQCKLIGERLGEDAIAVAKFYVNHNDALYSKDKHPIAYLLKSAEGLHAQWQQGRPTTLAEARVAEKGTYHSDQMRRMCPELVGEGGA